ncbi:uncharacterized protein LOC143019720 [Oratosquilla oratoria]|uniref:uncharacterized protein LOC143019720 n=1 Tax=Oratosquilla oratoria TaxID=337810 RepID=UPI003F757900
MTWRIPLTERRYATLIRACGPTLNTEELTIDAFYDSLDLFIHRISPHDKIIFLGDLNTRLYLVPSRVMAASRPSPRICVLLLLVVPLATADTFYGPPKPAPCYGPPITKTETVTDTNTVTVTTYSTVYEEKVEVETQYTTEVVTDTVSTYVTVTTTNVVTETEQEYTTVYSTTINTNTVSETTTTFITDTVIATETECMRPSHPAPTSFVSADFGAFKGYKGFRDFDFVGYNPF